MKLVDWGPKVNAHVATYIFLFPKQTGFGLHMHQATSTNRWELLWEMAVLVSVQALASPKPGGILAVAQYIILGARNLFSQRGRLAFVKTTDLTLTVIWCGAFLSPVPLLHRRQIMHEPENCWSHAYVVQFEHIKPLKVIQQTLLWPRDAHLTQYLREEERNFVYQNRKQYI